jgi:hypothetical protein
MYSFFTTVRNSVNRIRLKQIAFIAILCGFGLSDGQNIFKGNSFSEDNDNADKKNVWKAVGLSVLLPGAGEMYLGAKRTGTIFMIADGAMLSTIAGFAYYAVDRERQYKTFAQKYAGANTDNKDALFFETMMLYSSRDEYNQLALLFTQDRSQMLPQTADWNWKWRTEQDQLGYYDIWRSSERAYDNLRFAVGAAALNRVISVIDVLRIYKTGASKWNLSFDTYPKSDGGVGLKMNLIRRF